MRILASGTPRLKRDLGYGCFEDVCQHAVSRVKMGSLEALDFNEAVPCSCSSGSNERDDEPSLVVVEEKDGW